jgi:hypothetical protein
MINKLQTKLAKFNTLPLADKMMFVAATLSLPWVWLALQLLGLRRLQAWLQTPSAAESNPIATHTQQVAAKHIAIVVNRAAQQPFVPATCLSRSLYLQWLLNRHGIASQVRIGIDKTTGVFKAHAWVECAGIPINDQPDIAKNFAVFPERHPYHVETK